MDTHKPITKLLMEHNTKLKQLIDALDGKQTITVDEIRSAIKRADTETDKAVTAAKDRAFPDIDWQPMDDAYQTLEDNAYLWISFLLDELDKCKGT